MSPLTLRRFRAERLLRQQFEELRGRVLTTVRGRLAAGGAGLDSSDLDACYAQAWQGLYAAVLEGQEIANPTGWLTLVTFRRAIEELRARRHVAPAAEGSEEPDFAAELDDRMRLQQLFEGLRGRLTAREREAAALCYLQGLSRSEAAARMGLSRARMRKLMDGQGPGRPGVAGKVGELAATIRGGGWCEEQGSLMRGLAYGILDPDGERYRLALIHRNECPACRAYVVSLRGLAVVLPPVLLPWGPGAGALLRGGAATGLRAHAGAGAQAGAGAGAGAQAGAGIGTAMSAPGAVGVGGAGVGGAAGGSWLLAGGSLGTKLAVGCLLALGVGAGCVAFTEGQLQRPAHRHGVARASHRVTAAGAGSGAIAPGEDRLAAGLQGSGPGATRPGDTATAGGSPASSLTPAARAAREFGLERRTVSGDAQPVASSGAQTLSARQASSGEAPTSGGAPATVPARSAGRSSPVAGGGGSAAEREFGIG
jgi:RNA polymerase sigma factor (sigma-70 family)